jgi:DNA-binding Lrp family transcriptional regulator
VTADSNPSSPADRRNRAVGDLSLSFLLDQAATGIGDVKPRDALLVLAINQANIAPLTRQPDARARYGALELPAPDHERRPVSISAIASSLGLPFETVRRRVRVLAQLDVCVITGAGVIVPQAFLSSPGYLAALRDGHEHLLRFYRGLRADDLLDDLPASNYALTEGIPMRAAARLISDYVLRVAEQLMRLAGDLMDSLVLLGIVRGDADPEGRTSTVVKLAKRLQMPHETIRRHVAGLVERGQCVRAGRGLMVTEEMLARPAWTSLFRENAMNVQRLFSGLAERGVIDAWRAFGAAN